MSIELLQFMLNKSQEVRKDGKSKAKLLELFVLITITVM